MRDPFPIPPIPALSRAVQPLADHLGLTTLPLHIHEVLAAALLYTFVQLVVSPVLSRALVPHVYNSSMSRGRRANWDAHVVSLVQSLLINGLALWCMATDDERRALGDDASGVPGAGWRGRIYGYTGAAGLVQSLAAGYFIWDLLLTASYLDVFGLGLLAHASSALAVYSFGFRPFLNYYGCTFLMYELSTPFLNVHWFFDKLNMTGSRAQLYNGIALITTFFSCRLIYGNYMSLQVYKDMWAAVWEGPGEAALLSSSSSSGSDAFAYASRDPIPVWLFAIYTASNLTLNSLNVIWFFKMIAAVRKRFAPTPEEKKEEQEKQLKQEPAEDAAEKRTAKASAIAHDDNTPAARLRAISDKIKVEDDFTEVQ